MFFSSAPKNTKKGLFSMLVFDLQKVPGEILLNPMINNYPIEADHKF
jgi:hypothetical protein